MWLVKWFLAIPHYIVLVFLWIAFWVLTLVAFFAILFTARYPRGIFDFNVGVLRWTWRVVFYAWTVLGTDRYPPFTLKEVPDYALRVHVDHPERLSRGLVLVKWWLLALPHYLVVAAFTGGSWGWGSDTGDGGQYEGGGSAAGAWSVSLLGVLTLIAVVVLLFTGRYPRHLFAFLMGLVRWMFRVHVYALLMTDRYPPFRLDMGGREPEMPPETATGRPLA
ncbi:DUF4389 domain-containing protein [Streptomyces sp. OF3]|uniref:DUF4389 domain-containing protein n=5 Tax=Streptomyces alkaliterrae TaxID=2213162 RepID=A0A7W3WI30_9ACTN|nr:DUF4389 domain-containing protein [Streptomyces alkaliterrae]MBB1259518.1 DUF4389 domain-containing protein [Streptomyces alkaliterrae]